MRIAIIQYAPRFGEVEENLDRLRSMVADIEADIFLFPELFSTGYFFKDKAELRSLAEPFLGGPTRRFLENLARDKNAAALGGFPELAGERLFNSAAFVFPDGNATLYRKIHLFSEEKFLFDPGNTPFRVVEFRGARLGIMICFDWIFPESYRTLALRGADIVCQIANLVLPYCQKASYAHAVSNRIFVAVVNRVGTESRGDDSLRFTGQSIVYSPSGDLLGELGDSEESVLTVEITPEIARDKRVTEQNDVIADRRPEFYETA